MTNLRLRDKRKAAPEDEAFGGIRSVSGNGLFLVMNAGRRQSALIRR
jgi:hypothetical protein